MSSVTITGYTTRRHQILKRRQDLRSFFASAIEFAWKEPVRRKIKARRAAMSGELFFDILLRLGGKENAIELYPPTNYAELCRLINEVDSTSYDQMKRDCLIYYLLRWQMDGTEETYIVDKMIPGQYVVLADAYWHLDSDITLERAISLLSDVRIKTEHTTKILETLALSPQSSFLIRKFMRICQPPLTQQVEYERYIVAIAEQDFMDAWQYQRTFAENSDERRLLIHALLTWALDPKPKLKQLTQFFSVPFSIYEHSVVKGFAIHPPDSLPAHSVALARDMVCAQLIQSCKYIEAVKFDHQFRTGPRGFGRMRIIDEVLSIIPAAEKSLLDSKLGDSSASLIQGPRTSTSGSGTSWTHLDSSMVTDLSKSWEEIRKQPTTSRTLRQSLNGHAPPARHLVSSRPRVSLTNGLTNNSTPGASSSTPRAPQQLSAESTFVLTQSTNIPASSGTPSGLSSNLYNPSTSQTSPSSLPTQRLSDSLVAGKNTSSGIGLQKTNAFMTRNAFFNPSGDTSDTDEVENILNKSSGSSGPSKRQPWLPIRLPTPPQDEQDMSNSPGLQSRPQENGVETEEDQRPANGDHDTHISEPEDLSFAIFPSSNGVSQSTPRRISPRRTRKSRMGSEQLDLPGAFVVEERSSGTGENLSTPTSYPVQSSTSGVPVTKRTSRKRAASPNESTDSVKMRIPGTLFEEDEDEFHQDVDVNGKGDEIMPLPRIDRDRGKTSVRSVRTKSGHTSRASTVDPEENGINRPVRRSSRISTTTAPEKEKKGSARPRKSTRTSSVNATATGKGGTKRR